MATWIQDTLWCCTVVVAANAEPKTFGHITLVRGSGLIILHVVLVWLMVICNTLHQMETLPK